MNRETKPQKTTGKPGWASVINSGIVTFLMLILLALATIVVIIPKIMGGMSLTVLSGSMEPSIKPGDIIVTKGITTDQAADLHINDIITFLPYPDDPTLVTHRITAITVSPDGHSFTTQGDNNNTPDTWNPVHDYQIRGQVIYIIPKLGHIRQALGTSIQWIIPLAAILLIGYGVVSFAISFRKPKTTNPGDAETPDAPDTDPEPVPTTPATSTNDQHGEDDSPQPVPRRAWIE